MLKTKSKFKLLVALGIILLAMLLLGTTKVNATEVVTQSSLSQQEIQVFNAQFIVYEGNNVSGVNTKALIQLVKTSNLNNEYQVKINKEISDINQSEKYQIICKYDNKGLVNEIVIGPKIADEEIQEMLDAIPNEIALDITEIEYEKTNDIIKQKVETIWKNKGLSTSGLYFNVYEICIFQPDFYEATIVLDKKTKKISISYSNSNQKSSADEQYIKNLKITSPKYYEVPLDYLAISDEEWSKKHEEFFDMLAKYYTNMIGDNSITVHASAGAGGADGGINLWTWEQGTMVAFFKNGIFYDVKSVGQECTVPVINVPNTVKENEFDTYVKKIITESYNAFGKGITKIEKGTKNKEEYGGLDIDIPNGYSVYSSYADVVSYIIINRTDSAVTLTDSTTNIKLETSEGVVPTNTTLEVASITEGTIYNTVKTVLTKVKNFKVFDINLLSNGVKIQPNGKVKISITVPTNFDKTNLAVYRIEDNGEKIEYEVILNGDLATFETDHFSTYVLAEKEITERKKDDTPKTGTKDIVGYLSIITLISAIGIIIFRKKETK